MAALPDWLITALYQNNQARPLDQGQADYDNPHLTMRQRVGLDPIPGQQQFPPQNPISGPQLPNGPIMSAQAPPAQGQTPRLPYQLASQQPSIPIQSPQGAPQSMVTAPNSGLTGFAPLSGPVLGMGGNGGGQFYGLGTQSPSPGPGESPLAAGPLAGKQVTPQSIYNQLNAPRIQQFQQQLAQMLQQIPTLRFG